MVLETEYYDLLEVKTDATAIEIKKSYRKLAIKHHPDKNPDDEEAKVRFQNISEAYQVLSDVELRKRYDQFGKDKAVPAAGFEDPLEAMTAIFGGESFGPWIGELSMLKEMQEMTEIRSEEAEAAGASASSETANATGDTSASANADVTGDATADASASSANAARPINPDAKLLHGTVSEPEATELSPEEAAQIRLAEKEKKQELKKKQREELRKLEEKNREAREKRIAELQKNLLEKISVWTETDKSKDITESFLQKIQLEADELKLESFGLELLYTIGTIYAYKGSIHKKSSKYLGFGGVFSKLKEKGSMVRDGWNTITTALDAQNAVNDMAKMEESMEEVTVEERTELESSLMGKILAAVWMGSRMEVQSVIREVCDRVINDETVSYEKRSERAQALIYIGKIFKETRRSKEEAEQVQMFEELVSNAMLKKKKGKKDSKDAKGDAPKHGH